MSNPLNDLLTQDPAYHYGTLWPLRYKLDANGNAVKGTVGWAVPSLISGAVNAMSDLVQTPGQVLTGKQNPVTDPMIGPRLAMEWGGTATPLGAGLGQRGGVGMFGSLLSATADREAYKTANELEHTGAAPEEIWNKTGWFRGGDSKWRYEIPDQEAKLKTDAFVPGHFEPGNFYLGSGVKANGEPLMLPDVLDHPKLFDAYPELREVNLQPTPLSEIQSTSGAYAPGSKLMSLTGGPEADLRATVHHETQHAIDSLEGNQAGGNVNQFLPAQAKVTLAQLPEMTRHWMEQMQSNGHDPVMVLNAAIKQRLGKPLDDAEHFAVRSVAHEPWGGDFNSWMDQRHAAYAATKAAEDLYRRTGGEVMARNVESRLKGQPGLPPWNTEDVSRGNQIWNPEEFIAAVTGGRK